MKLPFASRASRSRLSLLLGLAIAPAAVGVFVACNGTDDPRAGRRTETPGGNGPPTGGGGLDASLPTGPLECGDAPVVTGEFSKQRLLEATSQCAAWHACAFQDATTALRTSVRAHADAPTDETHTAAQSAWFATMATWSAMEIFQIGPVASKALDKYHGRGLRSFVHPWPDHNRCQVETQVVQKGYESGWNVVFPGSRGLFGLEYLLFYPGTDTVCLPNSSAAQAWAAESPDGIVTAKNAYAVALADNLAALAAEVRNVWAEDGENFVTKLTSFDGYGSEQETLNVVAWALMYPEKEIKDWKLGGRAGVQATTTTAETPFAGVETTNMRANFRAFRRMFQGCGDDGQGIGFDDWLVAAGQQPLANDMIAAIDRVQAAADAFPAYGEATEAQFLAFYNELKPLSDLLKTNFFGSASPLNLKLPASAASDTD